MPIRVAGGPARVLTRLAVSACSGRRAPPAEAPLGAAAGRACTFSSSQAFILGRTTWLYKCLHTVCAQEAAMNHFGCYAAMSLRLRAILTYSNWHCSWRHTPVTPSHQTCNMQCTLSA